MKVGEIFDFYKSKDIDSIYHANTVQTSISLLNIGGIVSRKYLEDKGAHFTTQYSDTCDKKFNIWGDIFVDTVDIHARASRQNYYGPVLFVLDINVLASLPKQTTALITKSNPVNWNFTMANEEKYFLSKEELNQGWSYGNFGQMLTIRLPDQGLPFNSYLKEIIFDNPPKHPESAISSEDHGKAYRLLQSAAQYYSPKLTFRSCRYGCKCSDRYKDQATTNAFIVQ